MVGTSLLFNQLLSLIKPLLVRIMNPVCISLNGCPECRRIHATGFRGGWLFSAHRDNLKDRSTATKRRAALSGCRRASRIATWIGIPEYRFNQHGRPAIFHGMIGNLPVFNHALNRGGLLPINLANLGMEPRQRRRTSMNPNLFSVMCHNPIGARRLFRLLLILAVANR